MRFGPTPDQLALAEVVGDLLQSTCPGAVVRTGAGSPATAAVWASLVELGAPGLLVADDAGGLGLDECDLTPVLVEVGRAAVPLPVVETVAVAPGVLAAAGLADRLLQGALVTADPSSRGLVRFAGHSDLLLSGGWNGTGPIEIRDLSSASLAPQVGVDAAVDLARVTGGEVVAVVDDPAVVRRAWQRGVLGTAAELIGLSRRLMAMTVEYVGQRQQFGVPIGSFQAVKHHLASAALAVEFAAPVVAAAAWAVATDAADAESEVHAAKAMASDAAAEVSAATLQCHGAIAYTTEYDWQLYAKRVWALSSSWGSAAWHRAGVADRLGLALARPPRT